MKNIVKQTCSLLASQIFSGRRLALETGKITPTGRLDRLITDALIHRAAVRGDHEVLRSYLAQYWQGSAATAFYETYSDRFEKSFLGEHYCVVQALFDLIGENPDAYKQLYEIGCGDGQVLNHLSQKFLEIEEFVGLDINQSIIEKNRAFYKNPKLNFQSGDATSWLTKNAKSGSILLSYGGVMEYFLEKELLEMFALLKQKSPIMITLVEPLYDGYDQTLETHSRSSGKEHSFSHSYAHLLQQAGFTICYDKETKAEFRWATIIAKG